MGEFPTRVSALDTQYEKTLGFKLGKSEFRWKTLHIQAETFFLGPGPISWSSNKRPITSLSSSEAEYMAATPAGQECIWLKTVLNELNIPQNCIILHEDNQAAIQLSTQSNVNKRTKHIDMHYHWIGEKINHGIFKLTYSQKARISIIW